MDVRITPRPLSGTVDAISSKSDAHRLLICAALSDRETAVSLNCVSQDIDATCACLRSLGASVVPCDGGLRVIPIGVNAACGRTPSGHMSPPTLDCGESGSTLRFLLPVAAALCPEAAVTGRGRLPERPLSPLREQLEEHGCRMARAKLPLRLSGGLRGGTFTLAGNISSQYISGLLFALPLLPEDSSIVLTSPLQSTGYVNMTLATIGKFGVSIEKTQTGYRVSGGQRYRSPGDCRAEGDWSNAAFWLVAGALGKPVFCNGLDPSSLQGDRRVAALLAEMGADIRQTGGNYCAAPSYAFHPAPLRPLSFDAADIPDLVPILSVAAAAAQGDTYIHHVSRLRIKESDRLAAVCDMLHKLGGRAEAGEDTLVIHGAGRLNGGEVDSYGDHRMVMSAAVASLICDGPVTIRGAEAVQKSYPHFFTDFQKLGGDVHVL